MRQKILYLCVLVCQLLVWCNTFAYSKESPSSSPNLLAVQVFAGNDTSICVQTALNLSHLNASITGDVNDGEWITMGDGIFLPESPGSPPRFSQAQLYQPGEADINNGEFTLMLISDYDVVDSKRESNTVNIRFKETLAPACTYHVQIPLSTDCGLDVSVDQIVTNYNGIQEDFTLELFDEEGNQISESEIDGSYSGRTIQAKINYVCSLNSCWANIYIEDKLTPSLTCRDLTVDCSENYLPTIANIPILVYDEITRISDNEFRVTGLDACSDVILTYNDQVSDTNCANNELEKIRRTWEAEDEAGNKSFCIQTTTIINPGLSAVVFPDNFDDLSGKYLQCNDQWPKLDSGYPDPDTTGRPEIIGCKNLEAAFTDVEFLECGGGYKLLRDWFIIDWCTNESIKHPQIIQILDTIPPILSTPDFINLQADPYLCEATQLEIPISYSDSLNCSSVEIQVFNFSNEELSDIELVSDTIIVNSQFSVGNDSLKIVAIDDCGNFTVDTLQISVIDKIPPVAICKELSVISLLEDGTARLYPNSLDDGSNDNCAIKQIAIKQIDSNCEENTDFQEYIEFCCEDVEQAVQVVFRVEDVAGNYNECHVEINVQDQLSPILICPPDITISCEFPYSDDLFEFGKVSQDLSERDSIFIQINNQVQFIGLDGFVVDNCSLELSETIEENIECGIGTIRRIFTAIDLAGNKSTCIQKIQIIDSDAFGGEDIVWPSDATVAACPIEGTDPDLTGRPSFSGNRCSVIESTFSDLEVEFVQNACAKILRKWRVIDWCQYDVQTNEGLWMYDQVIEVKNLQKPMILNCLDTVICSFEEGCSGLFSFELIAEDDCSPTEDLVYTWSIKNSSNVLIKQGQGNRIREQLDFDFYQIEWQVEDGCGNLTECKIEVHFKDCKQPNIYCSSFLSTTINSSEEAVRIWAKDLDLSSSDNCTQQNELEFSFSSNFEASFREFTCEDIPNGIRANIPLELWVRDEAGNADFCAISLDLQDNSDVCEPQISPIEIQGNVFLFNGDPVSGAVLKLTEKDELIPPQETTSQNGFFGFNQVIPQLEYKIHASQQEELYEGLSVIDVLLLQKHILGISEFMDQRRLFAADVNQSGHLSASDMVLIRKGVLGFIDRFPRTKTIRFFDPNIIYESFRDFPDDDIIELPLAEQGIEDLEILAIKMGDINFSYRSRPIANDELENRSIKYLPYHQIEESGSVKLIFYSPELSCQGIQFSILFDEISQRDLSFTNPAIDSTNLNILDSKNGKELRFFWTTDTSLNPEIPLFEVNIDKKYNESIKLNNQFENLIVTEQGEFSIALKQERVLPNFKINSEVFPNPFNDHIYLKLPDGEYDSIQISIFDMRGNRIHFNEQPGAFQDGFPIQLSHLNPGIYHLVLQMGEQSVTHRLVKI